MRYPTEKVPPIFHLSALCIVLKIETGINEEVQFLGIRRISQQSLQGTEFRIQGIPHGTSVDGGMAEDGVHFVPRNGNACGKGGIVVLRNALAALQSSHKRRAVHRFYMRYPIKG